MKICIISTSALPSPTGGEYGGLENVAFDSAVGLARQGNDVVLITTDQSKELGSKDAVDETGAKLGSLNVISAGPTDWSVNGERNMFFRLHDWVEQNFGEGQGVIIDHTWFGYIYYSLTGGKITNPDIEIKAHPRMKICHVIHGVTGWRYGNGQYAPPKTQFPRILGVSPTHAQYLSNCFGIPVRHVFNGMNIPPPPTTYTNGDYLLSLNRISREKGITSTVDVAIETQISCKIVGDDIKVADQNYVFDVMDRCEHSRGLVEYVGSVTNEKKWEYIRNCKALITCPDTQNYVEAFYLAAIEGFSMGKPIIALKNGGLNDIVQHGVNGFLCDTVSHVKQTLKEGAPVDTKYLGEVQYPPVDGLFTKHWLRLEDLDPTKIRETSEKFSTENMARNYFDLCQKVENGEVW